MRQFMMTVMALRSLKPRRPQHKLRTNPFRGLQERPRRLQHALGSNRYAWVILMACTTPGPRKIGFPTLATLANTLSFIGLGLSGRNRISKNIATLHGNNA
jgi:hypothetical protein